MAVAGFSQEEMEALFFGIGQKTSAPILFSSPLNVHTPSQGESIQLGSFDGRQKSGVCRCHLLVAAIFPLITLHSLKED